MERIKKALDKAREQRASGTTQAGAGTPAPVKRAASSEQITYTQTRQVAVRDEVLREHRIISAVDPDSEFAQSYKILRTRVLQQMRRNDWNVLAVTSPGESEGKSLTAINLAMSMAMEVTGTVLLVDANLHHPQIHQLLGFKPKLGLSDYLLDQAEVPDVLINTGVDRFVILPGKDALENPSEMLGSPKMINLVEELKTRYPARIVIFDLPPVLTAADVLAFSPFVDTTLLVVEDGKTQSEELTRARDMILKSTNIIGTVLNKVRD